MMLETNQVYCGNCVDVMRKINDNSVDLCVTSPPYNLGIQYDNYDDDMDWKKYYEWCGKWMREIHRVLKTNGRFCLNHYFSFGQSDNRQAPLMHLNEMAMEIGLKHHSVAIWWDTTLCKKTSWGSWISASAPYLSAPMEGILILYKDHWKHDDAGISTISKEDFMMATSGVWEINTARSTDHPAPFPIALPQLCINLLTYKDDLVLDPFCGEGNTMLACIRTGRRYIGIDISQAYVNLTNKRIGYELSQLKLDL